MLPELVRPGDQTFFTYWFALLLVLALVFLIGTLASLSRLPRAVKTLIWVGLAFRVVGSIARFWVLQSYYGAGDATGYFGRGAGFAASFRRFDFTPFTHGRDWYGSEFVRSFSGLVLALIGPSMFAEFIVFSLLSFVGLVGFAVAFHRSFPEAPLDRYLLWIWVFPSLWFWPSSIGKEALILMGMGVAVMGFIGRRGRINWLVLSIGLFLMFAVRPEVVLVLLAAIILAQWLGFEGRWTTKRIAQAGVLLVVSLVGISYVSRTIGIEQLDLEGIQEFVEGDRSREVTGGTSVEAVGTGIKDAPLAAVNILLRPFPWEARNPMVLLSALEVASLWLIVFLRRKNLAQALRGWRESRMLRLAVAFVVMYSTGLGMMVVNAGIIARQRVFLFPFIFLLLEAVPTARRRFVRRLQWQGVETKAPFVESSYMRRNRR